MVMAGRTCIRDACVPVLLLLNPVSCSPRGVIWTEVFAPAYAPVETQTFPHPLPRIMNVAEKIDKQVRRLPEQTQAEVLDFVEYLLTKTEQKPVRDEEQEWTRMSLASAMRGLEEESEPEYTEADLEERFSSS
jgi:hypothetical protein